MGLEVWKLGPAGSESDSSVTGGGCMEGAAGARTGIELGLGV